MPSDFDHAVSVQDVSLTYRVSYEKAPTLKGALLNRSRKRGVREIKALQNVSFDVAHGTVLGIVGSNGAGKSTLMRTVAGILPPTAGRIEVNGRVSTLLALGIGFNSKLSGRENVVLGGLAGGLRKEQVEAKYEEIADFAELGDFMDLPMKTYSSGMYGRLAFSVAVHMEPDILLVDEALSAGDAKFKEKATAKMLELVGQARTIFLVSHALGAISELCSDALWMDKGKLVKRGEPDEIVEAYTKYLKVGDLRAVLEDL